MFQQFYNVNTVLFEDGALAQVEGMELQSAQFFVNCAIKARKKAGADTMGFLPETQIETGGLNLIINYWFQRPDLVSSLYRIAQ